MSAQCFRVAMTMCSVVVLLVAQLAVGCTSDRRDAEESLNSQQMPSELDWTAEGFLGKSWLAYTLDWMDPARETNGRLFEPGFADGLIAEPLPSDLLTTAADYGEFLDTVERLDGGAASEEGVYRSSIIEVGSGLNLALVSKSSDVGRFDFYFLLRGERYANSELLATAVCVRSGAPLFYWDRVRPRELVMLPAERGLRLYASYGVRAGGQASFSDSWNVDLDYKLDTPDPDTLVEMGEVLNGLHQAIMSARDGGGGL